MPGKMFSTSDGSMIVHMKKAGHKEVEDAEEKVFPKDEAKEDKLMRKGKKVMKEGKKGKE